MKKTLLMVALVQACVVAASMAWGADKGVASPGGMPIMPIILLIVFGSAFYFLPALIGFSSKKDNKISILLLNFFLGWSLIGWVIALIWATSKDKVAVQHIYVQQTPPPQQNNPLQTDKD